MRKAKFWGLVLACVALGACEQKPTEADTMDLQFEAPIRAISTYLDGVHFYNGEMGEQVEAHHYVTILNEDVMQAVLFDGNDENARLIGVEYIISQELFEQLPPEEKKLWHSHAYEVKAGLAVTPGLPEPVEHEMMETLVSTYGKTWHTWHTHRNETVPMGIPALMMAFTANGQIDPELLAKREQRLGVDVDDIAARRADILQPEIDPLADSWMQGEIIQLERVILEDD
jgi:hypothetical protein